MGSVEMSLLVLALDLPLNYEFGFTFWFLFREGRVCFNGSKEDGGSGEDKVAFKMTIKMEDPVYTCTQKEAW